MPVTRYRDVRDMPPPPASGELRRRIREVFVRAAQLASTGYPPGVHRFRDLPEAQDARERVAIARARRRRAAAGFT